MLIKALIFGALIDLPANYEPDLLARDCDQEVWVAYDWVGYEHQFYTDTME